MPDQADQRCTLTYEDKRGNVLVADLHPDRVTMMVGSANGNDPMWTAWMHLTPAQARELAQAILQTWGEIT